MFCPECGKKNPKGSKFCEECGAELVSNSKEVKEVKAISKKPMDKKTKLLFGTIALIVVLFVGFFCVLSSKYKPVNIAKDYFLASANADTDKLYTYLGVKDNDFTSKKLFKKVSQIKKQELLNYSVTSEKKSVDGLTSTVKINYTLRGESSASVATIHLVKDKKNKFLFFDNWKISNESSAIVTDYRISAPKDSTVKLEGITLDKKYLDKENSSTYDVYVIPEILKGKYDASVTFKNGLTLEGVITVSTYGNSSLTSLNVSEEEEAKIEKKLPEIINSLYQNAIDKKAFNDIKKAFEYDGANLSDLESAYNSFMTSISSSGLTKFTVKEAKISNTKLSGSYVAITTKVSYEYSVTKSWFGEERTNNKEDSSTMYLYFDYSNGEYKLVDMSSMPRYFSVF